MQGQGRGAVRPPIGIAFDGDLGTRIDAILAVAMLNGFTAKTEARRISLSVSRPSLPSAQLADVVASFYRGRPMGGPGGGVGAISEGMIGMPDGPAPDKDTPPLAATLSKKGADGTPALHQRDHRPARHRRKRRADPESLAGAARRQRRHRPGRPADGSGPVARSLSFRPADRGEVQAAGRGCRIVPSRAARPDDQERCGRGQEVVRRVADADRRRRIRGRRRAAVSRGEHRQGFRVGARAPGRRRLPDVQADALRRIRVRAGRRAPRRAPR